MAGERQAIECVEGISALGNGVADEILKGFFDYVGTGRKRPKTIRLCVKILDQM